MIDDLKPLNHAFPPTLTFPFLTITHTTCLRSAVGNVSGYRCESDCRSRSHKFDTVHSNTFVEIDHEIVSSVLLLRLAQSFKKGCCQLQAKYWLTASSILPRKKCGKVY